MYRLRLGLAVIAGAVQLSVGVQGRLRRSRRARHGSVGRFRVRAAFQWHEPIDERFSDSLKVL